MKKDAGFPDLEAMMARQLQEIIDRRFVLPITIIIVGSNGVIMGGSYTSSVDGHLDCTWLTQYFPPDSHQIVALPTNVIYVDAAGDAARVLIEKSGDQVVATWVN